MCVLHLAQLAAEAEAVVSEAVRVALKSPAHTDASLAASVAQAVEIVRAARAAAVAAATSDVHLYV